MYYSLIHLHAHAYNYINFLDNYRRYNLNPKIFEISTGKRNLIIGMHHPYSKYCLHKSVKWDSKKFILEIRK